MGKFCARLSVILVLLFVTYGANAFAETVLATGRSSITGDENAARQAALDDAIRNAARQVGSHVASATDVENGVLERDLVQLRTTGKVTQVDVLEESVRNGLYTVTIRAVVDAAASCAGEPNPGLRKTAVFTLFPRQVPESSRVGRLGNVDSQLPKELAARLYPSRNVLVQTADDIRLDSDTRLLGDSQLLAYAVQNLADKYNTQYVITGTVVDMSMVSPHKYPPAAASRFAKHTSNTVGAWFGRGKSDDRERNFGFRVVVHDGLTGESIFDKVYNKVGIWNAKFAENTGFGSPRFWQTQYGEVANTLIDQAVSDMGEKLNCQPFMVQAQTVASDNTVYLPAGANQGVQVGNTFELYAQTKLTVPSQALSAYNAHAATTIKRLQSAGGVLTVTQTYPGYSLATTTSELKMNKQYIAISR